MLVKKCHGWLLPDALVALSLVSLSLFTTAELVRTAQRNEQFRIEQVHRARRRHDQALLAWAARQS